MEVHSSEQLKHWSKEKIAKYLLDDCLRTDVPWKEYDNEKMIKLYTLLIEELTPSTEEIAKRKATLKELQKILK